jgi:DNA-binding protein H-NS
VTNIEKIRSEMCECETDKAQLFVYIDCLEEALEKERTIVKQLKQKCAQFNRLKESFRKYRKMREDADRTEAGE